MRSPSSRPSSRANPLAPQPSKTPGKLLANLRQQPKFLPVTKHASRRPEPPSGLRDAHNHQSNNFSSRKPSEKCDSPPTPVPCETGTWNGRVKQARETAKPPPPQDR
jgi:hypothetical protein